MSDINEILLESEGRDMRMEFGEKGLIVTLLGHPWKLTWDIRGQGSMVGLSIDFKGYGHDMKAKTPADCPGCKEFVK